MKIKNVVVTFGLMPLLSIVSCATSPQRTSEDKSKMAVTEAAEGRVVTNAAAVEAKAHDFVEIEFRPGSAELTDRAKASLASVVEQARRAGKIDEVIVLSWSDKEYPSNNLNKLSKPEIALAEKRNKVVEEYIKTVRDVKVDTYNMAERPNSISKWFNTTDNKLKNSFIAAGLPTTADSPKYPSKASHSVVLVKIE
jgi:hypothetical protein